MEMGAHVDYARFARLTIGTGAAVIVAAAALSLAPSPDAIELVAVLLLLAVLVGAVQWGRRGGTITALAATVIYVLLRVPDVASKGLTAEMVRSLLIHAALYGLVGIAGGEACARMKFVLARTKDALAVDEESLVYTPRFFARLVIAAMGSFQRYGAPFSVIVLTIDSTPELGPRDLARTVGSTSRRELRLVDEVGRLESGAFAVLLPQTAKPGAEVVASPPRCAVADAAGTIPGSRHLGTEWPLDDLQAIEALVEEHAED